MEKLQSEHTFVLPNSKSIANCQQLPKSNKFASITSSGLKYVEDPNSDQNVLNEGNFYQKKKLEQLQSNLLTEPYAGIHQVRPIRVSPPKPGKLYPCLSDIESVTENESESDEQPQGSTPHSVE